MITISNKLTMPEDLVKCIEFHGHICPGLIYGYRVAKEAMNLLDLRRAHDEQVVAICENDSCAVDAIQVLLGTSIGKGNLIIKDFGKNAYSILYRSKQKAYRFARNAPYVYRGKSKNSYDRLETAISKGIASEDERREIKRLKVEDLLTRPFGDVFTTSDVSFEEPSYAPLERSESCFMCGEMTMSTKMVNMGDGRRICIPCSQKY